MIRKLTSGIYTWSPLVLRVLRKVEDIVRDELDQAGYLEMLMPAVQPAELWNETGRWEKFGPQGLVLISVARQEKADIVAPFVKKYGVTWAFGLDPERTAYAKYAEAFIPRNTLVGPDGKIIFQSDGFEDADFKAMITAIDKALTAQK